MKGDSFETVILKLVLTLYSLVSSITARFSGDSDLTNSTKNLNLSGSDANSSSKSLEINVNTGFQLATQAGPLCNEPMAGVAFVLQEFQLNLEGVEMDGMKIFLIGHYKSNPEGTNLKIFQLVNGCLSLGNSCLLLGMPVEKRFLNGPPVSCWQYILAICKHPRMS